MLTIRDAQMQAMRDVLGAHLFEAAMVEHLRATHGARLRQERSTELQQRVRQAMKLAAGHGITAFADCAKFLELTLEFGNPFPDGLDWAAHCLAATAGQTGERRAQALLGAAISHLNEVEASRAKEDAVSGESAAVVPFDEAPDELFPAGEPSQ